MDLSFSKSKIIILIIIFALLALTNKIYLSENLLLSFELNKYIYGILGIIRASGRMIWPVYYLIFFTGIIFIFRNFNNNKGKLTLSLLLIIQIIDLSPGLKNFYKPFMKLTQILKMTFGKFYQIIMKM